MSLADRLLMGLVTRLRVPRQDIGEELPNHLMERYHLALFERVEGWPFVRVLRPKDSKDRKRPKLVLHRILRGDNRAKGIHSHPWWFVSVVVAGSYLERYVVRRVELDATFAEHARRVGSIGVHLPMFEHIVIDGDFPCWTLAFLGPQEHAWGFPFTGEVVRRADGSKVAESVAAGPFGIGASARFKFDGEDPIGPVMTVDAINGTEVVCSCPDTEANRAHLTGILPAVGGQRFREGNGRLRTIVGQHWLVDSR